MPQERAEHIGTTKIMKATDSTHPLTFASCLIRGGIGFTIVSVAGFAVWAFGGKWFYAHVGEAGLYLAITIVFLGLSGVLLSPLIVGERKLPRFYKIFVPAFLLYAAAWCACWFALRFGAGEWLGSLAGCVAFALVLAASFKNFRSMGTVAIALFVLHSAGYFAGDIAYKLANAHAMEWLHVSKSAAGVIAKLLWGVCFGAGFGLGIGYAFFAMQRRTQDVRDSGKAVI